MKLFLILSIVICLSTNTYSKGKVDDVIVVKSTLIEEEQLSNPNQSVLMDKYDIMMRNNGFTSYLVEHIPGIQVRESEYGLGSPVIRGLSGYRVLSLIDGIRLNNSITRLSSNNFVGTVDPFTISRLEVIKGPLSVLYGSDAIGGTVNYITMRPIFAKDDDLSSTVNGLYRSSNNGFTYNQNVFCSFNDSIAFVGSGTYGKFNDLRAGGEIGKQNNTGYDYLSGFGKALFRLGEKHYFLYNFMLMEVYDVYSFNESGKEEDGFDYRAKYRPSIKRMLTFIRHTFFMENIVDKITTTISFQRQSETKYEQAYSNLEEVINRYNSVDSYGTRIEAKSRMDNVELYYGIDIYLEDITSRENIYNIVDKTYSYKSRGEFQDDSNFNSYALYLISKLNISKNSLFTGGIRYSYYDIDCPIKQSESYYRLQDSIENIQRDLDALTGTVGYVHKISKQFIGKLNLSQGYRVPNVEDLSAKRNVESNYWYEGNPDLSPEQFYSVEASIIFRETEAFSIGLTGYFMRGFDLYEYEHRGFVTYNNVDYPLISKTNIGSKMYGTELQYDVEILKPLSVYGNLSYSYGEDLSRNVPMFGIPPIQGLNGIKSRCKLRKDVLESNMYVRYAARRTRLHPVEKIAGVDETDAWWTLNLSIVYFFEDDLRFMCKVENIFDKAYKVYNLDSYMYSTGIDMLLSVSVYL